jgi:hypothetical protein
MNPNAFGKHYIEQHHKGTGDMETPNSAIQYNHLGLLVTCSFQLEKKKVRGKVSEKM